MLQVMDKYIIEKIIGEGAYGIVFKARERESNDVVAIKKFKSLEGSKHLEKLSEREAQVCSMLSHQYIVPHRHTFRHQGLLHLVFDYIQDNMTKMLNRNPCGVSSTLAQTLIYQLCQALYHCHQNQVIHRDVKPENILLDENCNVRLCDFGVSRTIQMENDPLTDYVATRWYRAPEQELRLDRYSFDADVWSVGCILVELLTGKPLFPGESQLSQLMLIQKYLGSLPPTYAVYYPRDFHVGDAIHRPSESIEDLIADKQNIDGMLDFIHQTLQLEPKRRLTAKDCLNHVFLRPLKEADDANQALLVKSYPGSEDVIEEEIHIPRIIQQRSDIGEEDICEDIQELIEVDEALSPTLKPRRQNRSIDAYEDDFED